MRIVAQLAGILAAVALVAAGCGTGGKRSSDAARPKALDPGGTLLAFLGAAEAGDEAMSLTLVTLDSRRDLDFTRLTARAQRLEGGRIALSEPVETPWAIAAVVKGPWAYAVPLRREGGVWRIELRHPIRLRPILPHPGTVALSSQPQIAAEGKTRIGELGIALWLDGAGVPLNAGGPRPGYITAFGRFGHDLAPGLHVVVAFARASTGAVATAWTFTAPRRVA